MACAGWRASVRKRNEMRVRGSMSEPTPSRLKRIRAGYDVPCRTCPGYSSHKSGLCFNCRAKVCKDCKVQFTPKDADNVRCCNCQRLRNAKERRL